MKAVLFLVLVAGAAGGCSTVKPWQRELLAQPGMRLDPTPDARAEQHMLESREASAGGFGGGGGGCGCN
jgi:hypothetical protein